MTTIQNFQQRFRFVNSDGTLTPEASRMLRDWFARIGGPDSISLTEVVALLTAIQVEIIAIQNEATALGIEVDVLTESVNDDKIELSFVDRASDIAELRKTIEDALREMTFSTFALPNTMQLDYLDFATSAVHATRIGRLAWNKADDTMELHHTGGVTQQVGLETYLRAINHSGATITNGSCVGFAGVNGTVAIEIEDYIADGTISSLYVLGVATQDIANNEKGRVTVWGNVRELDTTGTPYGETWLVGDILYANTTTAGGLTNIKPTTPNVVVPVAIVLSAHATTGEIFVRPVIDQQNYYGSFLKTTDQTPAVINTAYTITFDSASDSNGVSIGTPTSRIVIANAGLYSFNASFQLTSNNASVKNVWLWFRKNGTDLANTAYKVSLESANALSTPSRSRFFSLLAADYIELMWAADDTNVTLDSTAATAFAPAAPACTLTVEQIEQ